MSMAMGGWTRRRLLPAALGLGMLASALAPAIPALVPTALAAEYGTVTEDGVLLRNAPGFDGAILGTLASGAGVEYACRLMLFEVRVVRSGWRS